MLDSVELAYSLTVDTRRRPGLVFTRKMLQ
jgi:hypothetical protein